MTAGSSTDELRVDRVTATREPRFDRFLVHSKNYVQQYNQIYLRRMELMKSHLRNRALAKWGSAAPVLSKIIDIEDENHKSSDCVLIGMVFKDLKLRGSVVQGNSVASTDPNAIICSDKDAVILEDHSGRVVLVGSILDLAPSLVTGVILAVKGKINDNGELIVSDYLHSFSVDEEESPCSEVSISSLLDKDCSAVDQSKYILLVSGLTVGSCGSQPQVHDLSLQLLVDFVGGRLGDARSSRLASRIARVIIAGNSVQPPESAAVKERFNAKKDRPALSSAHQQLDLYLTQLLTSCNVDILPGCTDPANVTLPQQPFHPCLFPHSARFSSFDRVTNPVELGVDEVVVMGHSGQPVTDIARQSQSSTAGHTSSVTTSEPMDTDEVDDEEIVLQDDEEENVVVLDAKPQRLHVDMSDGLRRLRILQDTLSWGHLCPTAPDTTPVYPFSDNDPFIIQPNNVPDLLFAGNQPSFASSLVQVVGSIDEKKRVRLVCLPVFRKSGVAVLVDISKPDLPCYPITFQ